MKRTNNKQILFKIFCNDVQIKKKVVSKLNKKTAYSSSSWSNSPVNMGFETLQQLLEGVKKNFFIKITRLFVKFSMNDVEIS